MSTLSNNNNDLRERWELRRTEDDDIDSSESLPVIDYAHMTLDELKAERRAALTQLEEIKIQQAEWSIRRRQGHQPEIARVRGAALSNQYTAVHDRVQLIAIEINKRNIRALDQGLEPQSVKVTEQIVKLKEEIGKLKEAVKERDQQIIALRVEIKQPNQLDKAAETIANLTGQIANLKREVATAYAERDDAHNRISEQLKLTVYETKILSLVRVKKWGGLLVMIGKHIQKSEDVEIESGSGT